MLPTHRLLAVLHNLAALKREQSELGAALDAHELCARIAEAAYGRAHVSLEP